MKATGVVFDAEMSRDVEPDELYDKSRYGNICTSKTPGSEPAWVQLPLGLWVMSYDGSDDFSNLGTALTLGELSIEWWMRTPHDWSATKGLFQFSAVPSISYNGLSPASISGDFLFRLGTNNKGTFRNVPADISGWHYYVLYIAGSGQNDIDNAVLYVDTSAISIIGVVKTVAPDAWDGFLIGLNKYGALACDFLGLKVHNYALTPGRILQRYEATRRFFGV